MVAEGLPDDITQQAIYELIAKRKKKLKEIDQINSEVPMAEIKAEAYEERLNDLREKGILKMIEDEGLELDDITLDMVEQCMPKEDNPQQASESKMIFGDGLVFADIECICRDSTNTFIPILICYTRGYSKKIFHHWGTHCLDLFLEALLRWVQEGKEQGKASDLTIFFHNLKGFDGVLTTNSLYKKNLKVTDHMGKGTKMLHFKHKSLMFKDLLSFLNMPLADFTKTFGLKELKKGFFPHKFSTLENLQYEGKIPDLKYYGPEHMSEDKKKQCEEWHAEQVSKGESWNFQTEMLEYCKSDVQ